MFRISKYVLWGLSFMMLSIQGNDDVNQKYYEWWQLSLGKTVSYPLFASWLGDVDAPSRVAMRQHVRMRGYSSLLDVPCGLCIDAVGLWRDIPHLQYYGLDVTQKLVDLACRRGIDAIEGDIEDMPYPDNAFDVVYARHILEHLPYYTKAVDELIRVAREEALIVFFMKPGDKDDFMDYAKLDGHMLYHSLYNRKKLEQYVLSNKKVISIEWETVNDNEEILHVYV